jgi:hypothetical protein
MYHQIKNKNSAICPRSLFIHFMREGDHLGDPGVDGRIILKLIFKKWDGARTGFSWLRVGTVAGSCECGNEPPGSIKCWEFLD